MKKINIGKSFKTNRFKYGGYSTMVTVLLLAILLVINVVIGKLDIKKDLTKDKLYSITDQSKNILKSLKSNVTIYAFFQSGNEDKNVTAVLDKYKAVSSKISVEYRDPVKQPQIAQKYSSAGNTVSEGTIVVESGSKFKTISYNDLFNYTTDQSGQQQVDSFGAEQQITNAIVYVNSDKEQTLYTLSGHDEKALSTDVAKQLSSENYSVKDINLLQGDAQLTKDSILVINSPTKDISKDEENKIKTFLTSGGRAAFFMDITKDNLPNMQELLSSYGVKLQNTIVVEGQTSMMANNTPVYLLPNMGSHDIVNALKSSKMPVFIPVAQGIEELKLKRSTTKIEPLLTSSSNSWGKVNLSTTTLTKESGDLQGPFNIAVAITDEDTDANRTTKLIVVGNSKFMDTDANSATNGTNLDFAMNSLNWLQDKKDSVTIRPKSLTAQSLNINELQILLLSGFVVVLIPAVVVILGVTVWLRRRHR